jgi:uncharacterized Zn-binding protein involved in type VI secretion
MKNIIRLGDPTTHGGAVTSTGAPHFTVSGKPVALVGDSCSCPVQGHQGCTIVSGNARHTINGKQVAYHGDKTSCGATLISTIATFSSA